MTRRISKEPSLSLLHRQNGRWGQNTAYAQTQAALADHQAALAQAEEARRRKRPMARMEIVTGRERRRRWSDEKFEILQEAATSGLSVADIARRHDVVPQQIYIWRRQLLAKAKADAGDHGAEPRFLPVVVISETEEPEADKPRGTARKARIEIRCKGGRVLKVEAGIDPAVLQGLIRSVEAA